MGSSRSHHTRGITIQDVARAAGVSVSTVSRVLNNKDDVAPETFQRTQDVIAELGYTTNLAARSLRSRRTGVIGLIMPELDDPFCLQILKGINQAILALDYDLIAYTSGSRKRRSKAEREQHYVSLLADSITDGVILVTPAATRFTTAAPIVAIDPNNECHSCVEVTAKNHAGALAATEYLISLGHRRIGFIGGRLDLRCAQQRLQGYQDALRQAAIAADPDLITIGDFSRPTGRECAQRLLGLAQPPTAIFAANDQSAIGAIEAARASGRRVPADLSVIGFDNIPEGAYFHPALTTVDQFIVKMGYVSTEMLIRRIQGEPPDSSYEMPTELVIRDSCQALKGGDKESDRT